MPANGAFNWRWDQGRIDYLRFDNIKAMAKVLVDLEGVSLRPRQPDFLRDPLMAATGLIFKPVDYKVWRNYGRALECAFLVSDFNKSLTVTDMCRRLADDRSPAINVDEYLSFIAPRFYYPFPAFDNYNSNLLRCFPFCATLKYLLAKSSTSGEESIHLNDVFSIIIGNTCTGVEPVEHYAQLQPTAHIPHGAQKRQVRELLIFFSQFSFLKWHRNRLYLDIQPGDNESIAALQQMTQPVEAARATNGAEELMSLAGGFSTFAQPALTPIDITRSQPADVRFTEGYRERKTHLRIERSPYLRRLLFAGKTIYACNMCGRDMKIMYPWTDNILEVHHLLPLSSALTITLAGTSLQDVVALCPNCHASVHIYYKSWLNRERIKDFRSPVEAEQVYAEAKRRVVQ